MKAVLDYLKARATELSSILAASGAFGILVAYLAGQITGPHALAAACAAVIGYVWPESKAALPPVPPALVVAFIFAASLAACSTTDPNSTGTTTAADGTTQTFAQQVAAFDAKAQSDIAAFNANALTDSIAVGKSACGYVSEANGLFKIVAPVAGADPAALATEAGTMVAVNLACGIIDSADPTQPATAQVATAAAQVVAAIPTVKAALDAADPAVAAVATAP